LAIFFFLPALTHHDKRCLNRSYTGQHEIKQDKREWIKGFDGKQIQDLLIGHIMARISLSNSFNSLRFSFMLVSFCLFPVNLCKPEISDE